MIEISSATKLFDGFVAVSGISVTIPDKCIFGMVGSNGAGKSTLMRMITGVYRPDAGDIKIDGESVFENPNVKQRMVFVADDLYYMGNASMDRMSLVYKAVYPKFDVKYYEDLKKMFGLDGKKSMTTFSKGMKRQAITILALSCRTDYIFFDETFDGLDPVIRGVVKSLLCKDIIDRGATAIITSHSLRELEDTCDQLALLHKGGLVLQSDIGSLKTNLFKIQVAYRTEYDKTDIERLFANLSDGEARILHFVRHGRVINIIMRGDNDKVMQALGADEPLLIESLPLTLEEVFTYEMEALGYSFEAVLPGKEAVNE